MRPSEDYWSGLKAGVNLIIVVWSDGPGAEVALRAAVLKE